MEKKRTGEEYFKYHGWWLKQKIRGRDKDGQYVPEFSHPDLVKKIRERELRQKNISELIDETQNMVTKRVLEVCSRAATYTSSNSVGEEIPLEHFFSHWKGAEFFKKQLPNIEKEIEEEGSMDIELESNWGTSGSGKSDIFLKEIQKLITGKVDFVHNEYRFERHEVMKIRQTLLETLVCLEILHGYDVQTVGLEETLTAEEAPMISIKIKKAA